MSTGRLMIKAKGLLISPPRTIALCTPFPSPLFPTVRCSSDSPPSIVTMSRGIDSQLDAIFQQKRISQIQNTPRAEEHGPHTEIQNDAIQSIVLEAPWFKSSKSLFAYVSCATLQEVDTSRILSECLCSPAKVGYTEVRKKLYVLHLEDRKCNMRMLKISSINDLVASSMNILEPAPVDCDGNEREDVGKGYYIKGLLGCSYAGLAFDRSGRRLGRIGGVPRARQGAEKKQPLLVALSYSLQVVGEGAIAITPIDVPVDALVSPSGFIPISPAALERYN